MGEASRNLAEKAKAAGSQQLDKATQAAKQVVEQNKPRPQTEKAQPPEKKATW